MVPVLDPDRPFRGDWSRALTTPQSEENVSSGEGEPSAGRGSLGTVAAEGLRSRRHRQRAGGGQVDGGAQQRCQGMRH